MSIFFFDNIKNQAERKKIINNVLSCMEEAGALNEFPQQTALKKKTKISALWMWLI